MHGLNLHIPDTKGEPKIQAKIIKPVFKNNKVSFEIELQSNKTITVEASRIIPQLKKVKIGGICATKKWDEYNEIKDWNPDVKKLAKQVNRYDVFNVSNFINLLILELKTAKLGDNLKDCFTKFKDKKNQLLCVRHDFIQRTRDCRKDIILDRKDNDDCRIQEYKNIQDTKLKKPICDYINKYLFQDDYEWYCEPKIQKPPPPKRKAPSIQPKQRPHPPKITPSIPKKKEEQERIRREEERQKEARLQEEQEKIRKEEERQEEERQKEQKEEERLQKEEDEKQQEKVTEETFNKDCTKDEIYNHNWDEITKLKWALKMFGLLDQYNKFIESPEDSHDIIFPTDSKEISKEYSKKIKKEYAKLSLTCHPDKNQKFHEQATEAFNNINQANTILMDPKSYPKSYKTPFYQRFFQRKKPKTPFYKRKILGLEDWLYIMLREWIPNDIYHTSIKNKILQDLTAKNKQILEKMLANNRIPKSDIERKLVDELKTSAEDIERILNIHPTWFENK